MDYPKDSILIVGSAKPSREDSIYAVHGEFYTTLILDRKTGRILDAGCNTIIGVTSDFVRQILVGKALPDDLPLIEADIRHRYFALTQKPLIASLKDAAARLKAIRGQV